MSAPPVSHKGYQIVPWPENAVSPTLLYLHVGQDVPAVAANTPQGWQILILGTNDDIVIVDNEAAARDWLETYGWERAA